MSQPIKIYSSCKALVIGVGHYADTQYNLTYARSDAEAMAELLSNEFGFDQVWTLYDNDATRQNISLFFEQKFQQTEEDDGLLIFFAGHGITVESGIGDDRGFLIPHDGDPSRPYSNISLTTIRDDYLPMIPAKHVFLIVDACYSGLALRDIAAGERPQNIDDAILAELTRRDRKVRQVLSAGSKDQAVLDGGLFGHSVFTGHLIKSLRDASPYISADHVGIHVKERVARDCLDRKHLQTPQFGYVYGGEGSFVFRNMKFKNLQQPVDLHTSDVTEDLIEVPSTMELVHFAMSMSGLNYDFQRTGVKWANEKITFFEQHSFRKWRNLFNFAMSMTGLNYNLKRNGAKWADERITLIEHHSFLQWKHHFDYAMSKPGPNYHLKKNGVKWADRAISEDEG